MPLRVRGQSLDRSSHFQAQPLPLVRCAVDAVPVRHDVQTAVTLRSGRQCRDAETEQILNERGHASPPTLSATLSAARLVWWQAHVCINISHGHTNNPVIPSENVAIRTKSAHNPLVCAFVLEYHATAKYRCAWRMDLRTPLSQERSVLRHYVHQPIDEEYGNAHTPQVRVDDERHHTDVTTCFANLVCGRNHCTFLRRVRVRAARCERPRRHGFRFNWHCNSHT